MNSETMSAARPGIDLHFGGARLDAGRRAVVDESGRAVELRSKTFDVLVLLMQRADSVVSKDELFEQIWNGAAVSEDTLVQCITEIRKAIGGKGHEALKTITKVGYRLVPDVQPSSQKSLAPASVPDTSPHPRGIAVLPFSNISDDPAQEFLAKGLTEDVITDLSSIPDLFVIARNSSYSLKIKDLDTLGIAADLGVRYLVEGSVRKSGERLRITIKLIDAQSNGSQIWAERYDRDYVDVFDIQDDIARQVARAIVGKVLTVRVNPRQRPLNMEAYELTLRSRSMWTRSKADCDEAILMLKRSVSLDPNYARTHTLLATALMYNWIQWLRPERSHIEDSLQHSYRAVELDPQDPVIRASHGFVLLHSNKWDEALEELDIALAMNPNGAYAYALKAYVVAMDGKGAEALRLMDIALKLNPHPPNWYHFHVAFSRLVNGDFAGCVAVLQRPEFARSALRRTLVVALELNGQHDEARKEAAFYMAFDPTYQVSKWLDRLPYRDLALKRLHIEASVRAGIPE